MNSKLSNRSQGRGRWIPGDLQLAAPPLLLEGGGVRPLQVHGLVVRERELLRLFFARSDTSSLSGVALTSHSCPQASPATRSLLSCYPSAPAETPQASPQAPQQTAQTSLACSPEKACTS